MLTFLSALVAFSFTAGAENPDLKNVTAGGVVKVVEIDTETSSVRVVDTVNAHEFVLPVCDAKRFQTDAEAALRTMRIAHANKWPVFIEVAASVPCLYTARLPLSSLK